MQIVSHEAKVIDVGFHGFGIKVSEVPVVRSKGQTEAILGSVRLTQLFDQKHKISSILELATAIWRDGIFPVDILI
jgi:hypothetical protein